MVDKIVDGQRITFYQSAKINLVMFVYGIIVYVLVILGVSGLAMASTLFDIKSKVLDIIAGYNSTIVYTIAALLFMMVFAAVLLVERFIVSKGLFRQYSNFVITSDKNKIGWIDFILWFFVIGLIASLIFDFLFGKIGILVDMLLSILVVKLFVNMKLKKGKYKLQAS